MRHTVQCASVGVLVITFVAAGCTTLLPHREPPPPPVALAELSIDEDVTELYAMMRRDWAIASQRIAEIPVVAPSAPTAAPGPAPHSRQAPLRPSADRVLATMVMPVVGVSTSQLVNSWGASRDGGRRTHRGTDIGAPRGTRVIAVTDGEISYVGTQSKAGRSVWLVTDAGVSFFYAHLDRWANGLREGQKVRKGDTIGYVGTTGNARRSSPHLHFSIHRDSVAINPYPHLRVASMIERPHPVLAGGVAAGGQ